MFAVTAEGPGGSCRPRACQHTA